jgi:hypothetical protein
MFKVGDWIAENNKDISPPCFNRISRVVDADERQFRLEPNDFYYCQETRDKYCRLATNNEIQEAITRQMISTSLKTVGQCETGFRFLNSCEKVIEGDEVAIQFTPHKISWLLANNWHTTDGIQTYGFVYRRKTSVPDFKVWLGGNCPFTQNTLVEIIVRIGDILVKYSDDCDWEHLHLLTDIIAYREIKQ